MVEHNNEAQDFSCSYLSGNSLCNFIPPSSLVIGWVIFLLGGNSGNNQFRRLYLISISRETVNFTFQKDLWVMLIPEGILACGKFPPIYVSDDEPRRWQRIGKTTDFKGRGEGEGNASCSCVWKTSIIRTKT